jgi:hypothetical protein
VFELMTPFDADGALPVLTGLVEGAAEEKTRDRLWLQLKKISDAQLAYAAACAAFGQRPKWARVLAIA